MIVSMSLGAVIKPKWPVLIAACTGVDWQDIETHFLPIHLCGKLGTAYV